MNIQGAGNHDYNYHVNNMSAKGTSETTAISSAEWQDLTWINSQLSHEASYVKNAMGAAEAPMSRLNDLHQQIGDIKALVNERDSLIKALAEDPDNPEIMSQLNNVNKQINDFGCSIRDTYCTVFYIFKDALEHLDSMLKYANEMVNFIQDLPVSNDLKEPVLDALNQLIKKGQSVYSKVSHLTFDDPDKCYMRVDDYTSTDAALRNLDDIDFQVQELSNSLGRLTDLVPYIDKAMDELNTFMGAINIR